MVIHNLVVYEGGMNCIAHNTFLSNDSSNSSLIEATIRPDILPPDYTKFGGHETYLQSFRIALLSNIDILKLIVTTSRLRNLISRRLKV